MTVLRPLVLGTPRHGLLFHKPGARFIRFQAPATWLTAPQAHFPGPDIGARETMETGSQPRFLYSLNMQPNSSLNHCQRLRSQPSMLQTLSVFLQNMRTDAWHPTSRSIQVVAGIHSSSLLLAEVHPRRGCTPVLFHYSPPEGHLDCFQLGALMHKIATNIQVQIFVCTYIFTSRG